MTLAWRRCLVAAVVAIAAVAGDGLSARQNTIDVALFRDMSWRLLGPFTGGRAALAIGLPAQPHTFYAGTTSGVWKTTDAGRTWRPIFDRETTGTIGSIAPAPSDPNVIYVGTGEVSLDDRRGTGGRGLFRSADAGQTWTHLGLATDRYLTSVIVDPANADRFFVASAGDPLNSGAERGIYRSTNGGRSFEKVFFRDEHTGALQLVFDPSGSATVYATLIDWRDEPAAVAPTSPPLLIRSTDGGTTWAPAVAGLPTNGVRAVRISATASQPSRLFALVDAQASAGLYRSDDGARSWTLVHADQSGSIRREGNVSVVPDPSNGDIVYLTGRSMRRSADGGRTLSAWAARPPAGASYALWINPTAPAIRIAATDRGAVVTLNGGETWSSVNGQPAGRFVDVITDAAFPYRVCAVSIDEATGCLPSRSPAGGIAAADWRTVSTGARVAAAPDPQDGDLVYTGARGRFDRRTGQTQYVGPATTAAERRNDSGRVVFAADNRTLYYGSNVLWRSAGGQTWSAISTDLSRGDGTISAIAPSRIDGRVVWAGTDDGLIHVTRDAGLTWSSRSPADLEPGWPVESIEPSHFDVNTAYATADATAHDIWRPLLWRTRDGGTSWQTITVGLPTDAVIHGVSEDALRRGLLFAATSASVFVSFDDGDRWQPLRLNLPPVTVTDITIKESDLVIATDGRGLWVLDDISPLRQVTADLARADVFLFRPATAWRTPPIATAVRSTDPYEAAGANPPDGVSIAYLASPGAAPVTIEIIETSSGEVIRRFSDLPAGGLRRVAWNLQYAPINERGVWVMPGTYQVRLTSGTRIARQAVIVRMDPRVRASVTELTAQFKLSRTVDEQRRAVAAALTRLGQPAADNEHRRALSEAADALDRALDIVQQADGRPTPAADATAAAAIARAAAALSVVP